MHSFRQQGVSRVSQSRLYATGALRRARNLRAYGQFWEVLLLAYVGFMRAPKRDRSQSLTQAGHGTDSEISDCSQGRDLPRLAVTVTVTPQCQSYFLPWLQLD